MHILICTDQHPDSVGGAQVSIRLQQRFLEQAGHTVTIVAPRKLDSFVSDPTVIALPALPLTIARDYGVSGAGKRSLRRVLAALHDAPPVDVVHIQGDFWGAILGYRLARALDVPAVHTMHNNLDVGTRAVSSAAPLLFTALRAWRRIALGRANRSRQSRSAGGAWAYLAGLAAGAEAVVAPTRFFADELRRHGVGKKIHVIATGVDDAQIDRVLKRDREDNGQLGRQEPAVRLVWCGRMSPEKRVGTLLDALREVSAPVHLTLVGDGLERRQLSALVTRWGLSDRVTFTGSATHLAALEQIAAADVLVQTSRGFETQGMTPYEATALGVPTLFCDDRIAAELGTEASWVCPDGTAVSLQKTIDQAASEVQAARAQGRKLTVSQRARDAVRQSQRSREMVALYESLLP